MLSRERRGDSDLIVSVGVRGEVIGSRFVCFVAVAPNLCSGVSIAFMDVFGAGTLFLTARGILEGLGDIDIGVGRLCVAV